MAESIPVTEYLYIDRERLKGYFEQLGTPRHMEEVSGWEASLSLAGPSAKGQQSVMPRPFTDHEMITRLCAQLGQTGQLTAARPAGYSDFRSTQPHSAFVLEDMVARKLALPVKPLSDVLPSLRSLNVWISDPTEPSREKERWDPKQTAVYLLEARWDSSDDYPGAVSGFSALSILVRDAARRGAAFQRDILGCIPVEEVEKLPFSTVRRLFDRKYQSLSPVQTLEELGAISLGERRNRSLYRKRYISDEQYYPSNDGGLLRTADLLAYPVFIASLD